MTHDIPDVSAAARRSAVTEPAVIPACPGWGCDRGGKADAIVPVPPAGWPPAPTARPAVRAVASPTPAADADRQAGDAIPKLPLEWLVLLVLACGVGYLATTDHHLAIGIATASTVLLLLVQVVRRTQR